jgi:hypothetical protein
MPKQIKSFDEVSQREGALNRLPPRLMPVELKRIVGSVSRTKVEGLTRAFLPRGEGERSARYRSVYAALSEDVPLPPIEVYALRSRYYVVDGHHRVAAARALGFCYLDALVHEFLLPATNDANRLHNERVHFERMTGLTTIMLSEAGQYRKLLNQIREHQFLLGQTGQQMTTKLAAADWYEYVYQPVAEHLAAGPVLAYFPERTVADLYVYLCDHKWVASQNRGLDIGFAKALADFERLYPPADGHTPGLAAPLSVLRALARPVIEKSAAGRRRPRRQQDSEESVAQVSGTVQCPICGRTIEPEAATCPDCQNELRSAG